MAIFLLLVLSVITAVTSQLLFKSSVNQIGSFHLSFASIWSFFIMLAKSPKIVIGIFLYGVSFLSWITLLTRVNLSLIYPISTSLNIIAAIILSIVLLHESLNVVQIVGIAIVILGVYLIFV